MRREGRRTVDELNNGLTNIDTKASKLMRVNIVFAGLLLSGFSFATKSPYINVSPFINSFSISGLLVLVTSIVAAGTPYPATESRVGVSPETIQKFVTRDLDRSEVDRGLAKAYARWIGINRRANVENAFYLSITILLVLGSVVLLSAGVVVGAVGEPLPVPVRLGLRILTLTIIVCIGSIADVRREYEAWIDHD